MSKKDDDGQRFLFPPYARGSDTSHDAAKSMASHAGTIRGRVLEYIRTFCDNGATCDQCELDLGLSHQTTSARINELRNLALIVDSGKRRKTRSGRNAVVWISYCGAREDGDGRL
jgi:hypothetical protein